LSIKYLLDTNILVRLVDRTSARYAVAVAAVASLLAQGHELYITAQNLIEFWSVATRPHSANGLGWDTTRVLAELNDIRSRFPLLDDTPDVFPTWLRLVSAEGVSGRQVHDARLVAVMDVHSITHLLTFNTNDFRRYSTITVVHPEDVH
jgi:predicted nucleic acid-binding protein